MDLHEAEMVAWWIRYDPWPTPLAASGRFYRTDRWGRVRPRCDEHAVPVNEQYAFAAAWGRSDR